MQSDVKLTDEERRVIAEIERYERSRRSRLRAASIACVTRRTSVLAWSALAAGVLVLAGGLVAGRPPVAFAGFVGLLVGAALLSVRCSLTAGVRGLAVRWRRALDQQQGRSHEPPRGGCPM